MAAAIVRLETIPKPVCEWTGCDRTAKFQTTLGTKFCSTHAAPGLILDEEKAAKAKTEKKED